MIFQQQSDLNDSKELSEIPSKKHEIDVFILKARWPDTACYILKLGNESSICSLPKEKNWIVAGLWPEIIGTNKHINCNSSATFDLNQLAKIRADLNAKFISVGPMNDTSLWERAWYSHGTCGSKVPEINSQFKYFNKTLELFNKYDIQGAFKSNNITIGNEYDAKEILAAIERTFGKHGMTACKFMTVSFKIIFG